MSSLTRLHLSLSFASAVTSFIIHVHASSSEPYLKGGFSVELIGWNSPRSPYYNPDETPEQRLQKAVWHSTLRANHLGVNSEPTSQVFPNPGPVTYLMSVSIGTPPVQIAGVLDISSDLIWIQCKPCDSCFKQVAPLFDPSTSSTYQNISCFSQKCGMFPHATCSYVGQKLCSYYLPYADGSFTRGFGAGDTITLGSSPGSSISFPGMLFGCGHKNGGVKFNDQMAGIIGLGGGPMSLLSQMGQGAAGKFSYCLVPLSAPANTSSTMNFGNNAIVSGAGTVSTPLSYDTFYNLNIEAISAGSNNIDFEGPTALSSNQGNTIIDSTSILSFLPTSFYSKLESSVASFIKVQRVPDPSHVFSLCYQTPTEITDAPAITVHFTGADVKLDPLHTFVRISQDVVCFAFVPYSGGSNIYGTLAQMNFLLGFDTQNHVLSFKPIDCTQI